MNALNRLRSRIFTDLALARWLAAALLGVVTAAACNEESSLAPFPATHLRFTAQPTSTAAGGGIGPVQVTALDERGNAVPSFGQSISLTILSDTGGAPVQGTTTVAAIAGVATFSNIGIHTAACYKLIASSVGLHPDTSAVFCITPGPAAALSFTVQPTVSTFSCQEGLTVAAFQLTVVDAFGNAVVSDTSPVHIVLGSALGSSLSGTTTAAAVAGVATFSDLTINGNAAGYTLVAIASGMTAATSAPFGVPLDACAHYLSFTVQPINTVVGTVIVPAIVVCVLDGFGNVDTTFSGNVTMAIGNNPAGGTLTGTVSVNAVAGCATFSNLSIDKAGSGYTLVAHSAGITVAVSVPFNIVAGAATQLVCLEAPTGGPTTLQVAARDKFGNTATSFASIVTAVVSPSGGTATVSAVAGVATFSNLSIPSGSTVIVTSGSMTVTCGPF